DENGAFLKFIVAFDGLVGRAGAISSTEMQRFADFILQVTYPPNPIRRLDNSLTADQQAGRNFYFNITSDTVQTCNGCHRLDPSRGDTTRRQVEQFMLAFDSNLAPIVGQQITLTSTNAATVGPRIDLLLARAGQNECDVVVKGSVGGVPRGAVRVAGATTTFKTDRAADPLLTDAQVRNLATTPGQEVTYTCVPPGSGIRIGIDRDMDGCLDFDDADPTDPAVCAAVTTTTTTIAATKCGDVTGDGV